MHGMKSRHDDPMHPLGRLIEDRKRSSDPNLTNSDIARRMDMSRQRVTQLIHGPVEDFLPTDTLRALARAINVSLPDLVEVMLETIELPSPTNAGTNPAEAEILSEPNLSDSVKLKLLRWQKKEDERLWQLVRHLVSEFENEEEEGGSNESHKDVVDMRAYGRR